MAAFFAGLITGVLSGFGVGGGTLLLIYMTTFAGVPQTLAQGINLLYFLPTAVMALPAHVKNGFIEKNGSPSRHSIRIGRNRFNGLDRHRAGCWAVASLFWLFSHLCGHF